MTTDTFSTILYNDGEEITHQDLIDSQTVVFSRLMDQLIAGQVTNAGYGIAGAVDPEFTGQLGIDVPQGPYAYCLRPGGAYPLQGSANNKLLIAPGTLMQKVGNTNGTVAKLVPFTFDGTTEFTIANGDATNPRVDILQMSLSYVDDTSTGRTTKTNPIQATLDLNPLTADVDTVVRAKIGGLGGNSIKISLQKRSSGVGVTYTENGNLISILYQDGVSTVANLEAAIVANSTLIEIQTAGTGANIITDPADSFSSTSLSGGVNALFVLSSINKRRRVQATLSMKQGTPAASPTYPTPDAGYCVIAGVAVGATYAGATPLMHDDTAGAAVVLHDQRMPFGVRPYAINPIEYHFIPNTNFMTGLNFNLVNRLYVAKTTAGVETMRIPLYHGGQCGRLIDASVPFMDPATLTSRFSKMSWFDGGGFVSSSFTTLAGANMNGSGSAQFSRRHCGPLIFQNIHLPAAGPTINAAANGMGVPIWTNGRRCPTEVFRTYPFPVTFDHIVIEYVNPANNTQFGPSTFYIAEGL